MQKVWRGFASPLVSAATMSVDRLCIESFYQLKQTRTNLSVVAGIHNVAGQGSTKPGIINFLAVKHIFTVATANPKWVGTEL